MAASEPPADTRTSIMRFDNDIRAATARLAAGPEVPLAAALGVLAAVALDMSWYSVTDQRPPEPPAEGGKKESEKPDKNA